MVFFLIFIGEILDASRRRTETWCETEENQFSSYANGICADTVRDIDGRYPIEVRTSTSTSTAIFINFNLINFVGNIN